jgi:hypothetical protein
MNTDDFIAQLVAQAYPDSANKPVVGKPIGFVLLGMAVSLALFVLIWGVNPELQALANSGLFEFRIVLLTLASLMALHNVWLMAQPRINLSRIGLQSGACLTAMLVITLAPLTPGIPSESLVLAQSHGWSLASVPSEVSLPFTWESVWRTSGGVAVVSLPVFFGLMWLMRHMAPIQPALAGAAAGVAATALGMLEFAFNAPYDLSLCACLGYLLCLTTLPAVGAFIGHRWLRW